MRKFWMVPGLVFLVLLSACGSSGSGSGSSTSSGSSGTPGQGTSVFPAVAHATDLNTAPVISAGTPPPPTELKTRNLVVGTGATATASDTVVVQYVGTSYDTGKVFDSSWSRGQPSTFPLSGVVPGFKDGIEGMKVGGRREMVIPSNLGYGAQGSPPAIKANETLVFVVDLKSIA